MMGVQLVDGDPVKVIVGNRSKAVNLIALRALLYVVYGSQKCVAR
jgi:hypothetical protein